ncbi:MAG TPA: hypothetical protein VFH83_14275 [Spirochaetia bacterium]|nr:hypothetical protein [Spirochaetia bacterium]
MKKVVLMLVGLLLTGAAAPTWSLPTGLATQAPRWYEAEFHVAWNLARRAPMVGCRFAFALGSPVSLGTSFYISGDGGVATVDAAVDYLPAGLPADLSLPLTVGFGFARKGGSLGLALGATAGVSWYPFTLSHPTVDAWLLGLGGCVEASFYLLPWGIEPLFVTGVMVPVNLSVMGD